MCQSSRVRVCVFGINQKGIQPSYAAGAPLPLSVGLVRYGELLHSILFYRLSPPNAPYYPNYPTIRGSEALLQADRT